MGKKKASKSKSNVSSSQRLSLLGKAILVLTALLIISVSVFGLIFLILGMVPSFVAAINDKGVGKCASKTVGIFNFMGMLPYIFDIWRGADPNYVGRVLLTSPNAWLFVYGASAFGWIMVLMMPRIVTFVLNSRAEIKVQHIGNMQKKLIDEWGTDVVGGADI